MQESYHFLESATQNFEIMLSLQPDGVNFEIMLSLQPDGVNFEIWLFEPSEFIVCNMKGLRHRVAKINRLKNQSLWKKN